MVVVSGLQGATSSSPGFCVAVEGLDGSGKSTLIDNLVRVMSRERETRIFWSPDPECVSGVDLLNIIERKLSGVGREAVALAFAANRYDCQDRKIRPFLGEFGAGLALVHRHVLSGLVYQHMQGLDLQWLWTQNSGLQMPLLTIFLDTPADVCEKRVLARGPNSAGRFERDFADTRENFQKAAAFMSGEGWKIETLSGDADPGDLTESAASIIRSAIVSELEESG